MIRPLRKHHCRIVIALALFLPVAFTVGIAARKPIPVTSQLPSSLAIATPPFENVEWQRADLFAKSAIQVRLLREHSGAGKFAVALSAAEDFVRPDLLVYWSAGNPDVTNALPDNAVLLGTFNSPQLSLPAAAETIEGTLVLFSLADNEIVDVSKPVRFNDSTK
jgi:hypothetical protein